MANIKKLVLGWERGIVKTSKQLRKMGYSSQLLSKYLKNRWLEKVGKQGAYKLFNDEVQWTGLLFAAQKDGKQIHVGGKTALTLLGLSHYGTHSIDTIFLYAKRGESLPLWMTAEDLGFAFQIHNTEFLLYEKSFGFTNYNDGNVEVRISSTERAILEMLYLVPKKHSFEESFLIMENLTSLRASLLQNLLENCKSIKVKRIFAYMANKLEYSWFKQLELDKIDFGTGKRMIVPGGEFDKKYQITVPRADNSAVKY